MAGPVGLPKLEDLVGNEIKVVDLGSQARQTLELLNEVGLTS
jgi:hypothetical protein